MTHDAISRFWENYIEKTKAYNLKPATVRWHVKHAEEYIKAHASQRLAAQTPQDVTAYLQKKGRNSRLADWQFAQMVRALQILFADLVKSFLEHPLQMLEVVDHTPLGGAGLAHALLPPFEPA